MIMAKKSVVFFFFFVIFVCDKSTGAVYKVGDSAGWTNTGHVDYKTWAASKTFHVGDIIVFEYNKQLHNVVRVTHKNFNACNATGGYETLASGDDSFLIKRSGHFYFTCSLPGHCESGQKVDIRVPRASSPSPIPAPPRMPPTPSPSPSVPQPIPPSISPSPFSPSIEPPAPAPNSGTSSDSSKGLMKTNFWLSTLVLASSLLFGVGC